MHDTSQLSSIDRALLERMQHEVPIVDRPWAALASQVDTTEADVIERVIRLREAGIVRQISAIFDTRRLGYESSLVAARVDPDRIEAAADVVSSHPGVSHNYQRDHDYNLWYTVAVAPDSSLGLAGTVDLLNDLAGADASLLLPALRVFRIGVNFDVQGDRSASARRTSEPRAARTQDVVPRTGALHDEPVALDAIGALQRDLPAIEEPFALLAEEHGIDTDELLERADDFRARGEMRRFAAVLHHRRAGFRANGMGVWIAPPDRIEELGRAMANFEGVSHCYARPTYEDWPYSLFTMTHGRTPADCEAVLQAISDETGLRDYGVLYSTREFKKVRVQYFTPDHAAWEHEHAVSGARA